MVVVVLATVEGAGYGREAGSWGAHELRPGKV